MPRFSTACLGTVFVLSILSSDLLAQRPFERFQNFRPDGHLLRELFGQDEDEDDEENEATKDKRKPGQLPARSGFAKYGQPPRSPSAPRRSLQTTSPKKHSGQLGMTVRESSSPRGLLVLGVRKSTPAWDAGIREGDLIAKAGGMVTVSREDIDAVAEVLKDGDQVEVEFIRRGKKKTVLVQLGDVPEDFGPIDAGNSRDDGRQWNSAIKNRERSIRNSDQYSDRYPEYSRKRNNKDRSGSDVDDTLNQNASSRTAKQPPSSREYSRKWQVQPPESIPSVNKQASTRTVRQNPNRVQIGLLQRELERKQIEIEILQRKIREAIHANGGESDDPLDSLFDIER